VVTGDPMDVRVPVVVSMVYMVTLPPERSGHPSFAT
jgi:hypothetical protein